MWMWKEEEDLEVDVEVVGGSDWAVVGAVIGAVVW